MAEENNQEVDGTIAGQHIRVKGYRFTDLLILLAFSGMFGMAWMVYQDMKAAQAQLATKTSADHEHIVRSVADLRDAMSEQTYVLTLNQGDRERLRIEMPRSLREKLYDDRRPGR